MRTTILFLVLFVALRSLPGNAQTHALQIDNGSGGYTTISSSPGTTGNFTLPTGSGVILTNTNISGYAWSIGGNSLSGNTPTTPTEWTGSVNGYDVVMKANGSEQMRLNSTGGVQIPQTTTTGTGVLYQGSTPLMHTYGTNNFFAGANAGNLSMTGTNNTAQGAGALSGNSSGSHNTANGYNAGATNGAGSDNTFLGYGADANAAGLTNATAIGSGAVVGQSNTIVLGNNAKVGIGTPTPGQKLEVNGNIRISGVNGLMVTEGANGTMGIATLVAGTVTVNTTRVTANSRIFLTNQKPGGAVGTPYVSARTAATSFTITSTSNTDTSDVAWIIIEP
jgi:hypothetical protein